MSKPDIIVIAKGSGFFVSHMWFNEDDLPEVGGFWEPYQTLSAHYATADEAEAVGRTIAADMGLEFHPWSRPYRTCGEAAHYDRIAREMREDRSATMKEYIGGAAGELRKARLRAFLQDYPLKDFTAHVDAAFLAYMAKIAPKPAADTDIAKVRAVHPEAFAEQRKDGDWYICPSLELRYGPLVRRTALGRAWEAAAAYVAGGAEASGKVPNV